MESSRESCLLVWVTVLLMLMVVGASGKRVFVGDKDGWKPDVNYTSWASQQTLYVGDWLDFRFDKHLYDVLEVNKTYYHFCKSEDFIANITKGGRDVYQLKEARTYYFICSKGYCYNGMKFSIDVHTPPPPPPQPLPNASASSLYAGGMSVMIILVMVLAISVFSVTFS